MPLFAKLKEACAVAGADACLQQFQGCDATVPSFAEEVKHQRATGHAAAFRAMRSDARIWGTLTPRSCIRL